MCYFSDFDTLRSFISGLSLSSSADVWQEVALVSEIELESVEFEGSGEFVLRIDWPITRSLEFYGFSFVGREFSDSLEIVSFSAGSMTSNVLFVGINGKWLKNDVIIMIEYPEKTDFEPDLNLNLLFDGLSIIQRY